MAKKGLSRTHGLGPVKVDKTETTKLLAEIVRIPSINPTGTEAEVAQFIYEWSRKNGLEATLDEKLPRRPNVYVTLRGSKTKPRLLFNGHLDVVPVGAGWKHDPFGAEIEGDRLYGRGASDMKAGLASALVAAKAIADSGVELNGELVIDGVIDEEGPGRGTVQALKRGITAEYGIVCEPTKLQIVTASKGAVDFELTITGRAAHSSVPEEGLNAIYKTKNVIGEIQRYSRTLSRKSHKLLGHPTISVDTIQGGVSTWIVPESCKIVVDRRTLPGETVAAVSAEIEALVKKMKKDDPELVIGLKYVQRDTSSEISADEEIVRVFQQECGQVLHKRVGVSGLTGTTDARFMINDYKIPTVIFGPGDLSKAHKPDEYVSLSEVQRAAKVYAGVSLRLLS
jgi:acetylornithine deacetylase/succinyl-diaminopimelate desuccinylase family protein